MSRQKNVLMVTAGILFGIVIAGPAAHAASDLVVQISAQKFYLDGQRITLDAYNINGSNYVKLGDLNQLLDFGLAYDSATNSVYIGERPQLSRAEAPPVDSSRRIPKAGDVIRCNDGTDYIITDVSRYDNNRFSPGPLPELPTATCDWSQFPQTELPQAEARHMVSGTRDMLFIHNLYETRRMQYTIYNALGREPSVWRNGAPLAKIELTIPVELADYTNDFWPWRASELEDLVHSRPISSYYLEAWDYYLNGAYQYTRYCVVSE